MSYEQTAFCGAGGRGEEIFWVNPAKKPYEAVKASLPFSHAQIEDAASRLSRFAPFLQIKFPETVPTNGLIESPLREIAEMRAWLHTPCPEQFEGKLLLKMDSHLAAAGSVKARGGIYEILHHAETLALELGMLKDGDSYARFADPDFRDFFGKFSLHVGSTGNLGLSVGVIGAAFGFKKAGMRIKRGKHAVDGRFNQFLVAHLFHVRRFGPFHDFAEKVQHFIGVGFFCRRRLFVGGGYAAGGQDDVGD